MPRKFRGERPLARGVEQWKSPFERGNKGHRKKPRGDFPRQSKKPVTEEFMGETSNEWIHWARNIPPVVRLL